MSVKSKDKIINEKKLINSFKYAIDGLVTGYKEEQNLRVHTIIAILVVITPLLFQNRKEDAKGAQ